MTKEGVFEVGEYFIDKEGRILKTYAADTDSGGEKVCDDGTHKCFFSSKNCSGMRCINNRHSGVIFREVPPKYVVTILGRAKEEGRWGENVHTLDRREYANFNWLIKCFEQIGEVFLKNHPEIKDTNPYHYFRDIVYAALSPDAKEDWVEGVAVYQIEALDYLNDWMPAIEDEDRPIDRIVSIQSYSIFDEKQYVNNKGQ